MYGVAGIPHVPDVGLWHRRVFRFTLVRNCEESWWIQTSRSWRDRLRPDLALCQGSLTSLGQESAPTSSGSRRASRTALLNLGPDASDEFVEAFVDIPNCRDSNSRSDDHQATIAGITDRWRNVNHNLARCELRHVREQLTKLRHQSAWVRCLNGFRPARFERSLDNGAQIWLGVDVEFSCSPAFVELDGLRVDGGSPPPSDPEDDTPSAPKEEDHGDQQVGHESSPGAITPVRVVLQFRQSNERVNSYRRRSDREACLRPDLCCLRGQAR